MVANISSDRSTGSGDDIDGDSESNTSRHSSGLTVERAQMPRCSSYQPQISLDRLRFHASGGSGGSGDEVDGDSESNTSRHSASLALERTQITRCPSFQPQLSLDRLRFHTRCGSLVKLSCNGRTAERTRPLDEFNDGVVMTNRTLRPDELFEVISFTLVYRNNIF